MFYDKVSSSLYTYCMRVMGDRTIADDIFQETFVRFYSSIPKMQPDVKLRAYMFTICRNLCFNEIRRRATAVQTHVEFVEEEYDTGDSREGEREEMLGLVRKALDLLPPDLKDVFILREYEGLSYQDIGYVVGTSPNAAKVRLFRARRRIRELVDVYISEKF